MCPACSFPPIFTEIQSDDATHPHGCYTFVDSRDLISVNAFYADVMLASYYHVTYNTSNDVQTLKVREYYSASKYCYANVSDRL